ncbi:MAG: hypothetical protein F6K31_29390 [Symploca sp. SIO2G7]|nr:hypothetical protein [Symploca sp. SIO2G7]
MNSSVLSRMIWDTPVNVFITNMVETLVDFGDLESGQPALFALLEVIREDVGYDKRIVIDKLIKILNQDIVFIFDTVEYMPQDKLSTWLEEFWEPLVDKAKQKPDSKTHLLMFLIDNDGSVCESGIAMAEDMEQPEYPRIPLNLPPASKFSLDALDDWINMVTGFRDVQIDLTAQMLFDQSDNGTPQLVYDIIREHWGIPGEG